MSVLNVVSGAFAAYPAGNYMLKVSNRNTNLAIKVSNRNTHVAIETHM